MKARQRCSAPNCDRWVKCKGLCATHYERQRKGKPVGGAIQRYNQHDLDLLAKNMRQCASCGEVKPLTEFRKTRADCRECLVAQRTQHKRQRPDLNRAAVARYRENNPEAVKEAKQRWYNRDPASRRAYRLNSIYGLSVEQFNTLLASQDGRCAICGTTEPGGKGKVFHIDHCHDTMRVRGLLCDACNRGIGFLRHDIKVLAAAIAYLTQPAAELPPDASNSSTGG